MTSKFYSLSRYHCGEYKYRFQIFTCPLRIPCIQILVKKCSLISELKIFVKQNFKGFHHAHALHIGLMPSEQIITNECKKFVPNKMGT